MYRADRTKSDPRFLLYALMGESVQAQLKSLGSGATVEHVRVPDCERLIVRTPSLVTQRRIGGFLGAIDDLIENNRRRMELLEQMVQAIYREWFINFRYPGHENQKLIDSEVGPVPEGWEVMGIGDTCSYLNRGMAPNYAEDGLYLIINQKCIRDGRLSVEKARRQSKSVAEQKLVRFGDVLINSTGIGTLGRVAQVYQELKHVTVDSHVTIARPGRGLGIDWFGLSLTSLEAIFEARGVGSTGQTELSRDAISRELLVVPPVDFQHMFGDMVGSLRRLNGALAIQAEVAVSIKNSLLPRLVTGRIDVASLDLDSLM
jgi:type I restriction enzyme S subunit